MELRGRAPCKQTEGAQHTYTQESKPNHTYVDDEQQTDKQNTVRS